MAASGVQSMRVGKRSASLLWRCATCFKQFRTPVRTDRQMRRTCDCDRVRHYFGPQTGNGAYLSTTVHVQTTG